MKHFISKELKEARAVSRRARWREFLASEIHVSASEVNQRKAATKHAEDAEIDLVAESAMNAIWRRQRD